MGLICSSRCHFDRLSTSLGGEDAAESVEQLELIQLTEFNA